MGTHLSITCSVLSVGVVSVTVCGRPGVCVPPLPVSWWRGCALRWVSWPSGQLQTPGSRVRGLPPCDPFGHALALAPQDAGPRRATGGEDLSDDRQWHVDLPQQRHGEGIPRLPAGVVAISG